MNRLLELENLILDVINQQEGKIEDRDETLNWERIHMASSARLAWEMALERKNADPEIAACAAAERQLLHRTSGVVKAHIRRGKRRARLCKKVGERHFLRQTAKAANIR